MQKSMKPLFGHPISKYRLRPCNTVFEASVLDMPSARRCIRPPLALCFPTKLAGLILIPTRRDGSGFSIGKLPPSPRPATSPESVPMRPNQHFAELRQKVCLYIHTVVLLRGLPSLEGKNKLFVGKKEEKAVSPTKSDRLYVYVHTYSLSQHRMTAKC